MFNIRVHVFVCLGAIITALTGISGVSANPVERYHRISSKRNADNTSTTYSVPATHITVGYRSVHPGQAAIYNEKHTLVYDPDAPLPEGVVVGAETTIQLGPGVCKYYYVHTLRLCPLARVKLEGFTFQGWRGFPFPSLPCFTKDHVGYRSTMLIRSRSYSQPRWMGGRSWRNV